MMSSDAFGPYRLDALLGRGGMGEVYRAYDLDKQRVVALKLLRAEYAADEHFQARFRAESRLAAQLNEPHVIPIHNYGELDGRLYIDMRYVEGRDLTKMLGAGPLPVARAVNIVEQVAAALDAAHAARLVHRDIKPSNVLVATSAPTADFCYLVDFGIARTIDSGASLTGAGELLGTPSYMAPERFDGQAPDPRSDVYSLACLLYEAVTGRKPFADAEPLALPFAHKSWSRPRPSAIRPELPRSLDDVVAHGMAPNPTQRPASAGELAEAAAAALTSPATASMRSPTPVPLPHHFPHVPDTPPPSRRITRRTLLLGAGGLAAAAGGIAVPLLANQLEPSPPTTGAPAADSLQRPQAAGTIRVGIAGELPYGYVDSDGALTGEAPTVARAVLSRLGINDLIPRQVEFSALIPSLNANQFDIIAAGIFINPERCAFVAYSSPDFISPTAFLVPAGNPQRVRTFNDVRATGVRLGIISGSIEEEYVQNTGVPANQISVFQSSDELLNAVVAGSVYTAALANIALQDAINRAGPGRLEISNSSYFPETNGKPEVGTAAFAFRLADNSLREAFDRELLALQASGEWLTLVRPFGLTDANLPPRNLSTSVLCQPDS
jgi:serine/threonine-protein kinase